MNELKRKLFVLLAKVNKLLLPKYSKDEKKLTRLSRWDKVIIGYRYWVTKNSLKE